jgi:ribosomal protein L37AE/L43A
MPWLTKKQPRRHECNMPTRLKYRSVGDVWMCGKCERAWKIKQIHSDYCGGMYYWATWYEVVHNRGAVV